MTTRVICAWAAPRSVSTAFEKTFTRRTGTAVVHEPFTDCYYFGPERRSSRYGDAATVSDATGPTAVASILAAGAGEIFVKDLAFQAEPYVTDSFLAGVTNTFLVRHPSLVYRSLVRLKPDFTEDEFGFTALHRLYRRVTGHLGQPPIVVDGTDFRAAPERVLRRYCERVGIPFDPRMLHWDDGRIRAWGPDEELSQAKWHATLEASHGILPPDATGPVDVPADRTAIVLRALHIYGELTTSGLVRADPVVVQ